MMATDTHDPKGLGGIGTSYGERGDNDNPIGFGIVTSLARPGGNVTGMFAR